MMATTSPRPWLPHDRDHLRPLALEGNNPAVIAKQLARAQETIRNRVQKLHISFKRRSGCGLLLAAGLRASIRLNCRVELIWINGTTENFGSM